MKYIAKIVLVGLTIVVSFVSAIVETKAAEKRMVIYASHPTKLVDYFVERFKEKYGNIEVDLITGGTGELLGRVQAEKNRPQGDIMFGGGSYTGGSAPELFLPYDSPALDGISPAFHDPKGYNAPFDAFTMVIVYNKNLVPEDEVPQRWSDLTDPKWKGRVVHANAAASSSAYAALVTWIEIGGWDLVEALAKNQIIVNSSSIPFTQVGQGENALGVTYEEGAFKWVPSGNVGIVYPKDGMALLPGGLFLIRDGPNPINARLFADFVLAHPQQSVLATEFLGRRPTHKDVKLNPAMVRVDELNLIKYPMEDAISKKKEILAKWKKVMMRTR